MTEHEQQIAIAEHQGWTKCRLEVRGSGAPEREPSPYGVPPGCGYRAPLPDYLHDWNAMKAAVNSLSVEYRMRFCQELSDVTNGKRPKDWFPKRIVESTLAEWSEAFLMTVGKWREG